MQVLACLIRTCFWPIFGSDIIKVGQKRIYTPYIIVYPVISLPTTPYIRGSGQP